MKKYEFYNMSGQLLDTEVTDDPGQHASYLSWATGTDADEIIYEEAQERPLTHIDLLFADRVLNNWLNRQVNGSRAQWESDCRLAIEMGLLRWGQDYTGRYLETTKDYDDLSRRVKGD